MISRAAICNRSQTRRAFLTARTPISCALLGLASRHRRRREGRHARGLCELVPLPDACVGYNLRFEVPAQRKIEGAII